MRKLLPRIAICPAIILLGLLSGSTLASPTPPRPAKDWYVDDTNVPTGQARFAITSPAAAWLGTTDDEEPAEDLLYRLQDGAWSQVDDLPGPTCRAIVLDVDSAGNLWLARYLLNDKTTYDGLQVDRFDGNAWRTETVTPGIWPQAMDMISPREGWLAGNNGLFLHYRDGHWRQVTLEVPADRLEGMHLMALAMADVESGWAVGLNGLVARYLDGRWRTIATPPELRQHQLNDIALGEDGSVWVVGAHGVIGHFHDGRWELRWPTDADLLGIDLLSPDFGWAVGRFGTILRFDGVDWQPQPASTTAHLYDVEVLSPDKGWIVGAGVLLRLTGRPPVPLREAVERDRYPMIRYPARRAAAADFDADGRLDLLILAANGLRLFSGLTDGGFRLAGEIAVSGPQPADLHGLAVGDVDGDGHPDVAVTDRFRGRNHLLRYHGIGPDGDVRFEDFPVFTDLGSPHDSTDLPYLVDLDGDGDLDLYLAREVDAGTTPLPDFLYRNDGTGHFVLADRLDNGISSDKGALWGDLDGDLDPDVVLPGYNSAEMRVYLNQGGRLRDHTASSGLDHGIDDGLYLQSHLVDLDVDGDLDLLMLGERLYCFLNDGRARFTVDHDRFGPVYSTLGTRSTASATGDLDHDGYADVVLQPAMDGYRELRLFLHRPDGSYREAADDRGLRGVSGWSSVLADWDDDGDLDLFVAAEPRSHFFENLLDDGGFVKVRPRRAFGNRQALGATVRIYDAGHLGEAEFLRGFRQMGLGANPSSLTDLHEVHFGTPSTGLYDVEVTFPGSLRSAVRDVAAGRTLTIHERPLVVRVAQSSLHMAHRRLRQAAHPLELAKLLVAMLLLGLASRLPLPLLAGAPLLRRRGGAMLAALGYLSMAGLYAGATAAWTHALQLFGFAAALSLVGVTDHGLERWRRDHRLGHFRLGRCLGRGGMGTVYLAKDTLHRRRVALKVIAMREEVDRVRFLREARVMTRLRHPNIVRIYEAGEIDGRGYLAMEPLTGRTLAARLRQSPGPSLCEVLRVADAILAALAEVHDRDIVHRDVKGENIFLVDRAPHGDGTAPIQLMDFGLSCDRELPTVTAPMTVVGTLTHLSPEQLRGQRSDERADLYALGVVLYESLSGRHPCAVEGADLSLHHLLSASPTPLRSHRPDLPADIEQVVMKLLASRPEERFASAAAARATLRRVSFDHTADRVAISRRGPSARSHRADVAGSGASEPSWQQRYDRARRSLSSGRITEADAVMIECLGLLKDHLNALDERDQQEFVERHEVASVLEFMDRLEAGAGAEGRAHGS